MALGSRSRGVVGHEPVQAGDGRHDDLLTAIERLCRREGVGPRDLCRVAVSIGPGGYTTLRIAVAAAKMLCESLRVECVAIETARVVARRVQAPGPFAVVLASKDETAFATVFDSALTDRGPGRLVTGLESLGVGTIIADRHLPKAIAAEAMDRGVVIAAPRFDPAACLELSFDAAAVDPAALAPMYPREPEAVTKWRRLRG